MQTVVRTMGNVVIYVVYAWYDPQHNKNVELDVVRHTLAPDTLQLSKTFKLSFSTRSRVSTERRSHHLTRGVEEARGAA
jgi:hypothetical protein